MFDWLKRAFPRTALTTTDTAPQSTNEQRSYFQNFSVKGGEPFLPGEMTFSEAGIQVNERTALRATPIWAGIRMASQIIGSLDIRPMKRTGDYLVTDWTHRNYKLLNRQPNLQMPANIWKELVVQDCYIFGNHYSYISNPGPNQQLIRLDPQSVTMKMVADEPHYFTEVGGKPFVLGPENVFHIIGFSWNGIKGVSGITQFGTTQIGSMIAADRFSAKYFANNCVVSAILEHPGELSDVARQNLRNNFNIVHQGSEQAFKLAILEEGMKYNPQTVNAEAAQLLESKAWGVKEAARLLSLPVHLLGDLEHSWATIAEENESLVKYYLRFWFERIEHEGDRKLFTEAEKEQGYHFAFDVDDLLRGQKKERYESHHLGLTDGWLSINDVHRSEGLPPVEGGDAYYRPMNMARVTGDSAIVPSETMGGPQIQAITTIIQQVAGGSIPRDSAVVLLQKILGDDDSQEAEALLGSAGTTFEPQADEPKAEPEPKAEAEPKPEPEEVEGDADADDLEQDVQTDPALVLNGAQVTAALDIVAQVTQGLLPIESAYGMLKVFFNLSDEQASQVLAGVQPQKVDVSLSPPGGESETSPDSASEPASEPASDEPDGDETEPDGDEQEANRSIDLTALYQSAAERVLTKEIKAIRRAVKKMLPHNEQGFAAWADRFYQTHGHIIRSTIGDVMRSEGRSISEIDKYSSEHIAESCNQIAQALQADDTRSAVDALATAWEQTRASEIAKQLKGA